MGIKASEGFLDLVAITDTATGLLKTGLAPTCTLYKISDGTSTSLTVAELGATGLYKVTNLTFGTATEYVTVWAVAGAYTIHYPFKLFKVGGGQEADLYTDTQALIVRLTALRAGYLDELDFDLRARLGTPAGASISADILAVLAYVDDLETRLSVARAGYLDNLSLGAVALASVCTSGRLAELDAANIPADVDTLVSRLTSTRAGYLDNLSGGAVALASDMTTVLARLTALRAGYLDNINNANLATLPAITATRIGYLDNINQAGLLQVTAARAGYLDNLSGGAIALNADMATLLTRLSATRAGYLDNLSAGAVALASVCTSGRLSELDAANIPADIDTLTGRLTAARAGYMDKIANHLVTRTWFSASQISVTLTNVAGDKTLPSVVLPNIAGTIVSVYVGFKFRMIENTNAGANKLNGAQDIQVQKAAGAFADCINFVDDQFGVAASTREGGDCIIGSINIVGTVDAFNATYNFQWDEAVADLANLVFNDVQVFLIISYY